MTAWEPERPSPKQPSSHRYHKPLSVCHFSSGSTGQCAFSACIYQGLSSVSDGGKRNSTVRHSCSRGATHGNP